MKLHFDRIDNRKRSSTVKGIHVIQYLLRVEFQKPVSRRKYFVNQVEIHISAYNYETGTKR
jgi:hypothetical protein